MSTELTSQGIKPQLDAYLHLSNQGVAQIVLALLLEEMLSQRLSVFRCDLLLEPEETHAARNSPVPTKGPK